MPDSTNRLIKAHFAPIARDLAAPLPSMVAAEGFIAALGVPGEEITSMSVLRHGKMSHGLMMMIG